MKKYIVKGLVAIFIMLGLYIYLSPIYYKSQIDVESHAIDHGIAYRIRNQGDKLQLYKEGKWENLTIKGISLSEKVPGINDYDATASKETITSWLEQIAAMSINTIKIEKIQGTGFYEALYEYNISHEEPLYIIHEIPLDEIEMYENYNAFNRDLVKALKKDTEITIDIIHGKKIRVLTGGANIQIYNRDLSSYVLGYTLGNEWKNSFVKLSVEGNKDKIRYDGKFIKGDNLNGFEYFLAEAMDHAVDYEFKKYGEEHFISFVNTIEFDPIIHSKQDSVYRETSINIDKLSKTDKLKTPIVGSYVISTEYTDFLNYFSGTEEYTDNLTDQGNENKVLNGYLKKLSEIHSTPIIVSSIGYSSGRACSFEATHNQYGYGGISEEKQGDSLVSALESIYSSGFSGAVINSWQDKWGKNNTWNTKHITRSDIDGTWLDVQSSNQSVGIMKFMSKNNKSTSIIDGIDSEWMEKNLISKDKDTEIYSNYDSNYLYLMIKNKDLELMKDKFYIGIDIMPTSGSNVVKGLNLSNDENLVFDKKVDFVASINGANESDLKVQSRYDIFNYYYKYYTNILGKISSIPEKDDPNFQSIFLVTRPQYIDEDSGIIEEAKYYDTGNLVYGNTNPQSKDYNSIADFYSEDNIIEIRIPFLMLNMVYPGEGTILDDFYIEGLKEYENIDKINLQLIVKNDEKEYKKLKSGSLDLSDIIINKYEDRLKDSYYILKRYLETIK